MAEAHRITGARTLWELIERRADADPDRTMLLDEHGGSLTFGGFRDRSEQVAAGLAARGIGEGTPVSWQLPTRISTIVLSGALCRIGAVQNPIIHLYRDREVGFAVRQTGARLLVVPGEWRGFDYPALAARVTEDLDDPPELLVVDQALPEGDPATLAPPPAELPAAEAPVRWIYYTSGSTADPKGVRHTDQTLLAAGHGLAVALDMSPDDVGTVAFPYAHIGGPDYLVTMLACGFPAVLVEAFSAPDVLPLLNRHGVTMVGGSTAFYLAFLAEQRKQPGEPVLPTLRLMSGGGAPKPPELHFEVQRELGVSGRRARLRHDRGADDRPGLPARHRRAAGEHRRRRPSWAPRCASSPSTARWPDRARRARSASTGRWCSAATPTPRSPRRPSTTRATSAPATWAGCAPTATS